jgi:hypothetical protein
LLTGTGLMYKTDSASQPSNVPKERSIFDSVPQAVVQPILKPEPKIIEYQEDKPKISSKYVDKVLIFYSDHTYDEYLKAQEPES